MTRVTGSGLCLLVVLTGVAGIACQLKRPETIPGRMIEPQLLAPQREELREPREQLARDELLKSGRAQVEARPDRTACRLRCR